MIINDAEYGEFNVFLSDDGTMDTVIEVIHNGISHEIRHTFDDDSGYYRDETGAMTNDGFKELAEQSVEMYIEQYLIRLIRKDKKMDKRRELKKPQPDQPSDLLPCCRECEFKSEPCSVCFEGKSCFECPQYLEY